MLFPSKPLLLAHAIALSILKITYNGARNFSNITDALASYRVYHRNPTNQIIHFFAVPFIIWSVLVFLSHLKLPLCSKINVNIPFVPKHPVNYATILTIGYIVFYIKLDNFGGTLYAPFAYFLYANAISIQTNDQRRALEQIGKKQDDRNTSDAGNNTNNNNNNNIAWSGTGKAIKLAAIVHSLGWWVQIHPGHVLFEGAKPAVIQKSSGGTLKIAPLLAYVTQSLGDVLVRAPLFTYYEGLWFLGLNKGLQEESNLLVDVYTKKMCDDGIIMRACNNGVGNYN
jgi:uncharacterized membrane protein YGL010W